MKKLIYTASIIFSAVLRAESDDPEAELKERLEAVKFQIAHLGEDIHRHRVSAFWYIGVDTHHMPEELRPPKKEKLLVCDTPAECREQELLWTQHWLND